MENYFIYRGARTSQISFPLGGIGTGCVGLAGNGRLIDWEIFNRPNKGGINGFSHFAIKAEREDGSVADARILHGDLSTPFQGELTGVPFGGFGWGPRREYLTGLPHFDDVDFRGEYPLAELTYHSGDFPGQVTLQAFNPLIPRNDKDSTIPAAFFEFSITNTGEEPLRYTLAGVLGNPLPAANRHRVDETEWGHALHLASDGVEEGTPEYGNLTLATDAAQSGAEISWQQYWFRGVWFDSLEVYWKDLNSPGPFNDRTYAPEKAGDKNNGVLAAHITVAPGETKRLRFVISWSFPNCHNYWKEDADQSTWKNYYATLWPDSMASAAYALTEWDRLFEATKAYHDALFASTLPPVALDAISANVSILKSPTVLRLEDGTFYGWEGCHPNAGCCEGSCTHVWNYAQALPFLFPALERSMRDANYQYNQRPDGGMAFRLQLPIGSAPWAFRPCVDGQFGDVLKTYRDWKICGDSEWLRELWPAVKRSIDFAWSPENEDRWDPDKTGVLWGRQHHTLDMELFGPSSWLTGFYLGALKAGAEMAEHLGETETAAEYREIFERGKAWVDENLFNGSYYIQRIDLTDRSIVEAYASDEAVIQGGSTLDAYWDEEHGEIKYQIAEGSSIDQIMPQWHADLYGLGDLYDREQVKQASAAIFEHNFIPLMRDAYNPCRIYCLNDEGGLVICAWPEGAQKPTIPAPYSQETMNGFEYSAAIHMIQNGLVEEGMTAVEALRQRYNGERRNPWNEFECGSNYARSMASYALLNAFSGFQFDLVHRSVGFNPLPEAVGEDGTFRCFWSLDPAWGEFESTPDGTELRVLDGQLNLRTLHLPALSADTDTASDADTEPSITVGGVPVDAAWANGTLTFAAPVSIVPGAPLRVSV